MRGFSALYAPQIGRSTTMLHEFEHIRHHDTCTDGVHDDRENWDGASEPFEACANGYGTKVYENDLFDAWRNNLLKMLNSKNITNKPIAERIITGLEKLPPEATKHVMEAIGIGANG